jgi:hypothetical protein
MNIQFDTTWWYVILLVLGIVTGMIIAWFRRSDR